MVSLHYGSLHLVVALLNRPYFSEWKPLVSDVTPLLECKKQSEAFQTQPDEANILMLSVPVPVSRILLLGLV